ncbi:hypothetical protein CLV52_3020 [Amnibacterium kyonggiense]|uniref:Uncharacterized protein n=1 Tax=Amnibacterium kyonggiense TaxID=595671 RepID=A0A4R7FEY7_9MICO|nr:hypothetical protein CLV52_3020 [Amnibacterium kyonggiense]
MKPRALYAPAVDELAEVIPNCPRCLHRRELVGEPDDLYWLCDCGVTPAT